MTPCKNYVGRSTHINPLVPTPMTRPIVTDVTWSVSAVSAFTRVILSFQAYSFSANPSHCSLPLLRPN